jgi:hypothetical protein
MRLLSLFAVGMAGLIAVPALAQTPPDGAPTRVRGTVEKLDDHNLTVKSRDGQSLSITLAPDVDIITLVKKSLADIKPGDFVASTGVKDRNRLHRSRTPVISVRSPQRDPRTQVGPRVRILLPPAGSHTKPDHPDGSRWPPRLPVGYGRMTDRFASTSTASAESALESCGRAMLLTSVRPPRSELVANIGINKFESWR